MEEEWKSIDAEKALAAVTKFLEHPPLGYPTYNVIKDALKAKIASGTDLIDGIPYCPNCHKAVGLDAKFCQNCGQKLKEESE